MKRKQKQPTDGVVAARLPINELEALKLAAQAEKRNVGNMIRVMIAEGVAARKNKANEV